MDPAQPGFQGKNPLVRLDNSDAKFVDVIHTDGKPFCPFMGLGMGVSVGTVDFFVNGGEAQPGCIFDGKIYNITTIFDIVEITIDGKGERENYLKISELLQIKICKFFSSFCPHSYLQFSDM